MADLDTLRPEVREALSVLDCASKQYYLTARFETIRAELLRLVDECDTLKAQSIHPRAQLLIMLGHANERAEKAEGELRRLADERDELRTAYTSASQSRDYWKECAGRVSSDLAALKARIAGSRHAFLGQNMDRITVLADDIGPVGEYAIVKVED